MDTVFNRLERLTFDFEVLGLQAASLQSHTSGLLVFDPRHPGQDYHGSVLARLEAAADNLDHLCAQMHTFLNSQPMSSVPEARPSLKTVHKEACSDVECAIVKMRQLQKKQDDAQPLLTHVFDALGRRWHGRRRLHPARADQAGLSETEIVNRQIPRVFSLPSAFPNKKVVFFFNWDDTFCPTSWIRSILTESNSESLDRQAVRVLTISISHADCCAHVLGSNLSGERIFTTILRGDSTFAELKSSMCRRLQWTSVSFFCEVEYVPDDQLLKNYSTLIAQGTTIEEDDREAEWRNQVPEWFSHPLPDDESIRDWLTALQRHVMDVIRFAQMFGVVCIVTNAGLGWIRNSIIKWMPQLRPIFFGTGVRPQIEAFYGQSAYDNPQGQGAKLAWLSNRDKFVCWKRAAMNLALDDIDTLYGLRDRCTVDASTAADILPPVSWCSSHHSKRIDSIISIGDDAASQAAEAVARSHGARRFQLLVAKPKRARRLPHQIVYKDCATGENKLSSSHHPWAKLVTCRKYPHVKELVVQLGQIRDILPVIALMQRDCHISMESLSNRQSEQKLEPHDLYKIHNCADLCFKLFGITAPHKDGIAEGSFRAQCV